jgi:hypothetical protein
MAKPSLNRLSDRRSLFRLAKICWSQFCLDRQSRTLFPLHCLFRLPVLAHHQKSGQSSAAQFLAISLASREAFSRHEILVSSFSGRGIPRVCFSAVPASPLSLSNRADWILSLARCQRSNAELCPLDSKHVHRLTTALTSELFLSNDRMTRRPRSVMTEPRPLRRRHKQRHK